MCQKTFDEVWIASCGNVLFRGVYLWMTLLRVCGVKFEREKNKCSLFLMFWFPKDRGWRMSAIRCSPFHFIHQTNKEEILLEIKFSVRSLTTEETKRISRLGHNWGDWAHKRVHTHINSRRKDGLSTNSRSSWLSIIMAETFWAPIKIRRCYKPKPCLGSLIVNNRNLTSFGS